PLRGGARQACAGGGRTARGRVPSRPRCPPSVRCRPPEGTGPGNAEDVEGAVMEHSTVQQVMTRTVVTAGLDTPYKRLVELLAEHRISARPIVDGEDGVIGVVAEGDLLVKPERADQPAHHGFRHHRELRRKAEALSARELMTVPAVTVPETATVAEAARVVHS